MYIFMGHLRLEDTYPYEPSFWSKNKIDLIKNSVSSIDSQNKKVIFESGQELSYSKLLLATGSTSIRLPVPGIDLPGVFSLYSLQDLERIEAWSGTTKKAVILGGGLIGVELAEMMHSRGIDVTVVIREQAFSGHFLPSEDANLISQHIKKQGIKLITEAEVKAIHGQSKVEGIELSNGESIDCDFLGVTIGVTPRKDLGQSAKLKINRGFLVNDYMATSDADIFAAGDCAELIEPNLGRKSIEPVWYTAKMQGAIAAKSMLAKQEKYEPGVWFNSAKFFDIEYQVYGNIQVNPDETTGVLFWQDKESEKSLRVHYNKESLAVIGFQSLGTRHRHEVWENWIANGVSVKEVIKNFSKAEFDPEFHKKYAKDIQESWSYV